MVDRIRSNRASATTFKKGRRKVGGRKKGTPNKATRMLKEAVLLAAENVGSDGRGRGGLLGYLERLAKKDHRTFTQLLLKVMPMQLHHDVSAKTTVEVRSVREEIERRVASIASRAKAEEDTRRLH